MLSTQWYWQDSNSPEIISATVDPQFTDVISSSNIPDGQTSVGVRLTIGGKTYGPISPPNGDDVIGEDEVSFPSYVILLTTYSIAAELYGSNSVFLDDYPVEADFVAALWDPQSYLLSAVLELGVVRSNDIECSFLMGLEAAGTPSRPCSGPYGNLCDHLEKRPTTSSDLPNTL